MKHKAMDMYLTDTHTHTQLRWFKHNTEREKDGFFQEQTTHKTQKNVLEYNNVTA